MTVMALIIVVSSLFVFLGGFKNFSHRVSNFYYWVINGFNLFEKPGLRSSSYKNRSQLAKELYELNLKYNRLLVEKSEEDDLRKENKKLRQALNIKKYTYFSSVAAEVYLKNPVFGSEYFSINKGKANGIKPGALAVTVVRHNNEDKVVVVGRISEVAQHTAVVRTILSPKTKLSVKLANSKVTGVITSGYRSADKFYSVVNYLPKKSIFEKGELIYTSGLSNFTPGGILVGELVNNVGVSRTLNETTYEQIECRIFAPLEDIKFVVILNRQ